MLIENIWELLPWEKSTYEKLDDLEDINNITRMKFSSTKYNGMLIRTNNLHQKFCQLGVHQLEINYKEKYLACWLIRGVLWSPSSCMHENTKCVPGLITWHTSETWCGVLYHPYSWKANCEWSTGGGELLVSSCHHCECFVRGHWQMWIVHINKRKTMKGCNSVNKNLQGGRSVRDYI